MNKLSVRELIDKLNYYTKFYDEGNPVISDAEWDKMYFQLVELENDTGLIYPDSPTQKISYNVVSQLKKVKHNHPLLSLDKTKDWNEFLQYFNNKDVIGMLKLDGLTCSLTYENGVLVSAETRGNGEIGEDIFHNACVIPTIPKEIGYKDKLVVDGEIICKYNDFEAFADQYQNPRNFASGSIRLLDANECAKRKLTFVAWYVADGFNEENRFLKKLCRLEKEGFYVTPWTSSFDWDAKEFLIDQAKAEYLPIDGLVGRFDDIKYGESLGLTGHHSRAAYAFKFYDDEYETKLIDIDYDVSRTGILTPVAVFEDVDTGDSIVNRASLHNMTILNILLGLPYKGQKIRIIKANAIIPQVTWGEKTDDDANYIFPPKVCPVCGGATEMREDGVAKILYCANSQCSGKLVNIIDHFAGKKGLDIKGLSVATINKLIDWGWVSNVKDIFTLSEHRSEWIKKPGFGPASVDKLINAIENAKLFNLQKFIAALGIPEVGTTVSKELIKYYPTWEQFRKANFNDFIKIDGIGNIMADNIIKFDYTEADFIVNNYMRQESIVDSMNAIGNVNVVSTAELEQVLFLNNKTFVITGKLSHYKNRDELVNTIESHGGKVTGSVSKNTTYLINNDINSASSKNATAKKLGIPIITEEDLIAMM